MTGSESINFGLDNIWQTWLNYKLGKKKTLEFFRFEYNLERNLNFLFESINNRTYKHGTYRSFSVNDNKKRLISEPQLRDKIVHRLVYDYLVEIYDKIFDSDVWSCRKGKGLIGAIRRVNNLLLKNPQAYFWKADVKKFFENIDHEILFNIVSRKLKDEMLLFLIKKVLESFALRSWKGIPLGNLTSQIFSNIYLNEFDRFVRHNIKPNAYLRYGDDFILIMDCKNELKLSKNLCVEFLNDSLKLTIKETEVIKKVKDGLRFLGVSINHDSIVLNKRNQKRVFIRLNLNNLSSYCGLIKQFGNDELIKRLKWKTYDLLTKNKPSPTADDEDYCSDC